WLYTPLSAAAELYAVLAVEHALRLRYEASPRSKDHDREPGLKQLLRIAISEKWIRDEGFTFDYRETVLTDDGIEHRSVPEEQRRGRKDVILEFLPAIRNSMAHGQAHMTLNHVGLHLQRATEIINQLFPGERA